MKTRLLNVKDTISYYLNRLYKPKWTIFTKNKGRTGLYTHSGLIRDIIINTGKNDEGTKTEQENQLSK